MKTKNKDLVKCDNCLIDHEGIDEPSLIFCDRVEYIHDRGKIGFSEIFDHHLMFWNGRKLSFKVYLANSEKDKEFSEVLEALKNCGIKCLSIEK